MTDLEDLPLFSETTPWEDVQSKLEALDLGDGLPLAPPTRDRLDAMLAGRGDSRRSFGHVMPLMGDLTLAAVAYNCVLAGCRRAVRIRCWLHPVRAFAAFGGRPRGGTCAGSRFDSKGFVGRQSNVGCVLMR